MGDEKYAVALAVTATPARHGIWDRMRSMTPLEAWESISASGAPQTQEYLTARYSRHPLEAADGILEACEKKSVDVIGWSNPEYPPLLGEIKNPPPVIFRRGTMPAEPVISIVGTRQADPHSASTARLFAAALARAGFAIASGMAVGIDREAHLGALHAGGSTIGVLANGIDIIYPSRNSDLFSAVITSGTSCLISEYPPGIMAGKWTFVRRNRIISGLARGTIVVKAGEKSGALITASCAAEQGREVFACPGPALDESYTGCHRLIRSGAVLAASPADVLAELRFLTPGLEVLPWDHQERPLSPEPVSLSRPLPLEAFNEGSVERRILESITPPSVVDDLIRMLGLPAAEVHQALNLLELEGIIRKTGNVVGPA